MTRPIYLDHNATTPVDARVLAELLPYLSTHFGNPSSAHPYGRAARRAIERAREQTAALVGAEPGEITFGGSGTECNWMAIAGSIRARANRDRDVVVTQATEHPSVLAACDALVRRDGVTVVALPVDGDGRVDLADVRAAVDGRTALVSIQLANGETGTLQPIAAIAGIAHAYGAIVHVDAAQCPGRLPIDVGSLGADLLTVVGHKMYAPKGVAALVRRKGIALEPLLAGGGQEMGLRPGTENVAGIVALGAAAELARADLTVEPARLRSLRDRLASELDRELGGRLHLNGHPSDRLPNTLNISIDGSDGQAILAATPAVAASTGAACHSGSPMPSPVLTAMGRSVGQARAALRLSVGRGTTESDVRSAAAALAATVRRLSPLHEVTGVERG